MYSFLVTEVAVAVVGQFVHLQVIIPDSICHYYGTNLYMLMTMPGVQNPHCDALWSTTLCWIGCNLPRLDLNTATQESKHKEKENQR